MAVDDIGSTGQFSALSAIDPGTSYQTSSYPSHAGGDSANPASGSSTTAAQAAAASSVDSTRPAREPTTQEVQNAIAKANANLAASGRQLDYRVDAATGISYALIRNTQTGVVEQQIPGANIIALARMLADWSPGKHMLLDLIA